MEEEEVLLSDAEEGASDQTSESHEASHYAKAILVDWPLTEVPTHLHDDVIEELRKLREQASRSQDFRRAQQINDKMIAFTRIYHKSEFITTRTCKANDVNERVKRAKKNLSDLLKKNAKTIQKFERQARAALKAIEERHQRELEEFDDQFDIPPN